VRTPAGERGGTEKERGRDRNFSFVWHQVQPSHFVSLSTPMFVHSSSFAMVSLGNNLSHAAPPCMHILRRRRDSEGFESAAEDEEEDEYEPTPVKPKAKAGKAKGKAAAAASKPAAAGGAKGGRGKVRQQERLALYSREAEVKSELQGFEPWYLEC